VEGDGPDTRHLRREPLQSIEATGRRDNLVPLGR
ncbi:MAG: hypothetical protein QOK11_1023, partial [Pseudonocardiales bacterium]|nr:hypothetical protein [Pseudonocardiales bacterium]